MITLTPSLPERKRILRQVCKKHPQWKVRIGFSILLFLIAAGIVCATAVLLIQHPTTAEGVWVFMAGSVCLGCAPFLSAFAVKNKAKFKCGLPYTSFANGTLLLKEDALEYVFWYVGSGNPAAYSSRHAVFPAGYEYVYRIPKPFITTISVKDGICTVQGHGRIQMPEEEKDESSDLPEFCKTFSFLLAFEQNNSAELIQTWRR